MCIISLSNSVFHFTFSPRNIISGNRSNLTTTIDIVFHLSIGLNGDSRITTHQSSITMRFFTHTTTKHVTFDNGGTFTRANISETDRYYGILFYSANLTTAIDITHHCSVTDGDVRSTFWMIYTITIFSYHGLRTSEGVGNTLTTTEHITSDSHTLVARATNGHTLVFR